MSSTAVPSTQFQIPLTRGSSLDEAIRRGVAHMLAIQHPDGYWWGQLETNVTITAEYLLLTHFLGVPEPRRWKRIAAYLRDKQLEDGGWPLYFGGPSDLNATVEAYFALKLAGLPADEPAMRRARERALALGGIPRTRVFTRVWLALMGQYDWAGLPVMPPELMFFPRWFPFNIYEFASWARETIVPLLVLFARRPVHPVPPGAGVAELYPGGRPAHSPRPRAPWLSVKQGFLLLDRLLHLWERLPIQPGRPAALQAVEDWILAHQEADGSWGGIQPPWVYSLMALHELGYGTDHPIIARGLAGFEEFGVDEGEGWWVQSCISPVWDTALSVIALREAGLPPTHPALVRAAEWLIGKQILVGGDWQVKNPDGPPGGWAFEFHNSLYPDTDDTAEVLLALRLVKLPDERRRRLAIERGFRWLLSMQSSNGGWGAFDRDNVRWVMTQLPFCDFGEVIDPPSEDVTAHIIECLGKLGYDRAFPPIARALAYLRRTQERDGAWFGRWGVNYLYGTGAVLAGLAAAGVRPDSGWVRRAASWLLSCQNADGGWGESCASYELAAARGRGRSMPSQTAWVLLGLLASGHGGSPTVQRGVDFLVRAQGPDGAWPEDAFTGTGFPRDFLIKYHLYRNVFPLTALGRYRRMRG